MTANATAAAEVTAWRHAVVVAYGASGLAFASWVSRLPAIRDGLDLTPGTVGLLLLCMTLGSFVSVSASGLIVLRLGSKQTIRTGAIMVGCGLAIAGFGTSVLATPVAVAVGLVVIGLGTASWNTASNVEGAAVERAVGRHIVPRLHGRSAWERSPVPDLAPGPPLPPSRCSGTWPRPASWWPSR